MLARTQTGTGRTARGRAARRGLPALVALASAVVLAAAAAPAAAAGHAGHAPRAATGAGVISTVAGGVGGPAKATQVMVQPCGAGFGAGHLYLIDGAAVRAVSLSSGSLATPAGTGATGGPLQEGGVATRSAVSSACGVSVDPSGNLLLAVANRIWVVAASTGSFYGAPMIAGHIYTVAGVVPPGFGGDRGPARNAKLFGPEAAAVDGAGNLLIADSGNNRIRVVAEHTGTFYGQAMTVGDIYTVAGGGTGFGLGDGGPAVRARLHEPVSVAVDGSGNLVISDQVNQRIRVVAESTGTFYGQAMTTGDIYTVAGDGTAGFSGDGGPATSAELHSAQSVAVDGAGNLIIADTINNRVRVVAASTGTFYGQAMTVGDIYSVAGAGTAGFSGDGGPAASASLDFPSGVTVDSAGNLVIADLGNLRARVVAAGTGTFYGQAMTAGNIYTVAGEGAVGGTGDGRLATTAQLGPFSVALDGSGDLMTVDSVGRAWLVAAHPGTLFGRAMTAGHIYDVAGTGTEGYSGDGGPGTSAKLNTPTSATADAAGNMVITDMDNFRVRVVAATTGTFYGRAMAAGHIYTVAGNGTRGFSGNGRLATASKLDSPAAVSVDGAGNLVFADGNRIRVVAAGTGTFYRQAMTAGHLYTVAGGIAGGFSGDGGPATGAELRNPDGTALDGSGNLLITDTGNGRVRVVAAGTGTFYGQAMTAGDIYTIAGNGQKRFSGDGGPATAASLNIAVGVTVDHAGNVVIADNENFRVRVVATTNGMFYGQAMTAGHIYTVAGLGPNGFSGDGGPARNAELSQVFGVAVDGAGDLLIADIGNGRIRMVTG